MWLWGEWTELAPYYSTWQLPKNLKIVSIMAMTFDLEY